MTADRNPGKPEWFEMAENDARSSDVRKVNKKLPALAVLITSAVIGAGAFFANASESDANAEQVVTQSVATTSPSPSPSVSTTSNPVAQTSASPSAIADPSQGGIKAPTGRGDDDNEGEDRKGEHREGDHEGREHRDERD
jgi:hypothetical protein